MNSCGVDGKLLWIGGETDDTRNSVSHCASSLPSEQRRDSWGEAKMRNWTVSVSRLVVSKHLTERGARRKEKNLNKQQKGESFPMSVMVWKCRRKADS